MATQKTIRDRYEIRGVIGHGGMGVVYRAFDPLMRREVAIKTLHDVSSQPVLDLFYRECDILRGIVHPNVIDILDMGDFVEDGVTKPYYVMPLLPGKTLHDLLHPSKDVTEPLSVDRAVEIIVQTSRGLHAAHERELLHRDVKPRNIFVIDEYSVKLIDFGVAHLMGSNSSTGVKGTLDYMAPEQLRMRPLSRRTDIFSLATVCYEILTGTQPFRRDTEGETAAAVVNWLPPLASEVTPSVPKPIAQVINKAMAKDPWGRFATAAEFSDALQRARRNEPMNDLFDPKTTHERVERVRFSFGQKDYQFASEILRELEAEGQTDAEVVELRRKVDEAVLALTAASLIESAERYFGANEYSLALRKVQEVLELDARHPGALALKQKIEDAQNERKVVELLQVAGERLEQAAFTEARKVLQDAQRLRPDDTRVRHMLSEVDSRQKDFLKQRQEQERLYQASQAAWVQRDISQALLTLERLAELARKTPEPRDRILEYKNFYKVVRGEHDTLLAALEQARQKVAEEDFSAALALCAQYLNKYPRHAAFAELKSEIEKQQREKQTAFRADVEIRLGLEPNLERQIQILEEAGSWYPQEPYYGEQLLRVHAVLAQVASVVEAAQLAEDSGDLNEALEQWARVASLYPHYLGLQEQVDRLTQARLRQEEIRRLLKEAGSLASGGRHEEARGAFRRAHQVDAALGKTILAAIAEQARSSAGSDWKAAEEYLRTAGSLDRTFSIPKDVVSRIEERKRAEFVDAVLARAAELRETGGFKAALQEIDAGLARYPKDKPLTEARAATEAAQAEAERRRVREAALQQARELARRAEANLGNSEIDRLLDEVKSLAQRYAGDPEVYRTAVDAGQQLVDLQQARAKVAANDLNGGRAICERYLKDSPKHAGFLDVQAQIEERERQAALEFMEEVNQRLQLEPDPALRLKVLEEALRRYPDEAHYRDELDLVREEQNMVRSTVEEADSLEKAGRFKDALDAWIRLRTVVHADPNLDNQIARLTNLHEQALREGKARWTEQIQQALGAFDYVRVTELLRKAEAEFPGQFGELAKQAKQGADQRSRAQRLIADAQTLAGKANWNECRKKLSEAAETAPADPLVLKQVLEADSKYARGAISSDWRAAEEFLDHAAALDPTFAPRPELRAKIEERRRAGVVESALDQSSKLRHSGELKAALDAILKPLEVYPDESKLRHRREDIEAALREAASVEDRKRVLAELRSLESGTRIADSVELRKILDRAKVIAQEYQKDKELTSVSDAIREQVEFLELARRLLAEGKFDESAKLAGDMQARFGDRPAITSLQREIQVAREQAEAAYLDEVTSRLAQRQDLAGREKILLEALGKYPEEPYYRQELAIVRENQRLTAEIANNARVAEKDGRYEEAVEQWKSLRTVYPGYPNLDAEIKRIGALLADKRSAARNTALAGVRAKIEEGNLQEASELLRRVESEFGAEHTRDVRARLETVLAAHGLADEGRRLFAAKKYPEGCEKFRRAVGAVPDQARFAASVLNELLQQATALVDSDWRAAKFVLDSASELGAAHAAIAPLRKRIEDKRQDEAVAAALQEARKLKDAGKLQAAEKATQTALSSYPGDARLTVLLTDIQSAISLEARRQQREQALRDLSKIETEVRTAKLNRLRQVPHQIQAIEARLGSDPEVNAKAAAITAAVSARVEQLQAPPPKVEPKPAPVAVKPVREATTPAAVSNRRSVLIGGGVAAALFAAFFVGKSFLSPGREIPVNLTSDVAGASVTVGGRTCVTPDCSLKLAPGTYSLTAGKDGYKPLARQITVPAQQSGATVPLAFEPLPQVVQVNTNFESGRVFLDGRAAGDLRDGQFSLQDVAPGQHALRVTGGGAEFQAEWRSAAGARPELVRPITAKDVQAAVLANAGETGVVACNCDVQSVTVDGARAPQAAGGTLKNLKEGTHQIALAGRSLVVDVRPNPSLSVFLSLDRNIGTIVIETNEDNARVYLNEKLYRRTTEHGVLRIPSDVGAYSIRVQKDGFRSSAPKTIDLKKGEEQRVALALVTIPPVLEIAGALPGAQVKVDGAAVGETDANGGLHVEVAAGDRVVDLTKDDYTPVRLNARFTAGQTFRPDRAQLTMTRVIRGPDPKQVEAQDFERIRASNNPADFDDFVRRHGDGAHLDEARTRAAQLRQQAADKQAADALAAQRAKELKDKEADALAAQRAKELKDKDDALAAAQRAKELKDKQDAATAATAAAAARVLADEQGVARALSTYEGAYNAMDMKGLQGVFSDMPKNVADAIAAQFRDVRTISFLLRPSGRPAVNGNSATVDCTRSLSLTTKSGQRLPPANDRVRVTLDRAGTTWTIRSITPL